MATGLPNYVDKPFSWVIAVAVCLNTAIMFGTLKSKGVFLVSLHGTFNIDRTYAAVIFLTTYASFFGAAIFGGPLTQIFGHRAILVTGSIVAALGTFLSSFVYQVKYLILTLGFLQGTGFGLCLIPNTAVLSHYFDRHRAKAYGIGFVGGPFGSLIFPPVIQTIIDEYTLRGAFLITSAVVLNMVAFSTVIKNPPDMQTMFSSLKTKPKRSTQNTVGEMLHINGSQESVPTAYGTNVSINEELPRQGSKNVLISPDLQITAELNSSSETADGTQQTKTKTLIFSSIKGMFQTKVYYPILFTIFASNFSLVTFNLTIPDFAVLEGSTPQAAAWLISIASAFDIVARLSSGVLLDMKIIRLSFSYALFLFLCASFVLMAAFFGRVSYFTLAAAAAGYGLNFGACQIHFPVSITNFMGSDLMPLTLSSGSAISVVIAFGTAPLISYFLAQYGNYVGIYLISAGAFYICSVIWIAIGMISGQ